MKFILILMLMVASTAHAQNVRFGDRGEHLVPRTQLSTVLSTQGESKEEFLSRVGRFLHNFTSNNKFEACAQICSVPNQSQFGVVTSTNGSHVGCLIVDVCPEGMVSTSEGIHSHPLAGAYQVNEVDVMMNKTRSSNLRRKATTHVGSHKGFSHADRKGGSGYLVEDEQLFYFDGQTERLVGPVAEKVFNN